jgi:hypothetical protein
MWLRTLDPEHRARVLGKARIDHAHDGDEPPEDEFDYGTVRDGALQFLGLKRIVHDGDIQFGHPLFSFELAPWKCTPADAARALRRTFEGKDPWGTDG